MRMAAGLSAEFRKPGENSTAFPMRHHRRQLDLTASPKKGGLMNIVKWNPFRELEDIQTRLNRVFNDAPARRPESDGLFFADWAPAVDIQETDKEYLIKAELPEMRKEDVKVEVLDGVLTIEGERTQDKEEKGKKFHKVERSYGKFVRQFALPNEVEMTNVQADYKDGVLNVHLPKTAAAKPKAVEVKVA
jgi:HSP20 family protein